MFGRLSLVNFLYAFAAILRNVTNYFFLVTPVFRHNIKFVLILFTAFSLLCKYGPINFVGTYLIAFEISATKVKNKDSYHFLLHHCVY